MLSLLNLKLNSGTIYYLVLASFIRVVGRLMFEIASTSRVIKILRINPRLELLKAFSKLLLDTS